MAGAHAQMIEPTIQDLRSGWVSLTPTQLPSHNQFEPRAGTRGRDGLLLTQPGTVVSRGR